MVCDCGTSRSYFLSEVSEVSVLNVNDPVRKGIFLTVYFRLLVKSA